MLGPPTFDRCTPARPWPQAAPAAARPACAAVRFLGARGDVLVTAGADGRAVLTDRRLGAAVAAAEAGAPLTALDARADGGCLAVGSAGGRSGAHRDTGSLVRAEHGRGSACTLGAHACDLSHVQAEDEPWCIFVHKPAKPSTPTYTHNVAVCP